MVDTIEKIIMELDARDRASKPLDRVRQRSEALIDAAKKLHKVSSQMADAVDREIIVRQHSNKAMQAAINANQQLIATKKAEQKAVDAAAAAQKRYIQSFGTVAYRARNVTGAIGAIAGSGVEQQLNIAPDLLQSVRGIGALKQELPALTSNLIASAGGATAAAGAMAAIGVALIGAVAVYKIFQKQVEESKAATSKLIDVNKRYAEVIAIGTSQEVREAIKANEERNIVLEKERERLRAFIDQTEDIDGVAGAILDLNDALNLNLGGYEDVQNRLDEVNKELNNNIDLNQQLGDALKDGATAAADMRQREAELAEERQQILQKAGEKIIADTKSRAQLESQIRQQALDASDPSEVNKQYEKLHLQYQATFKDLDALSEAYHLGLISLDEYRDGQRKVNEEQDLLIFQMGLLKDVLLPAAEAAKKAADEQKLYNENLKVAEKNYRDAVAAQEKYAADLAKVEQDRIDLDEEYAQKSLEIQQDRDIKLAQEAEKEALQRVNDLADHYKDLAELDQQYYADRADLLHDLQADLSDLDIGLTDDLASLKENLGKDIGSILEDRLNAQKEYNKEAARAAEDHYNRLQAIQDRANSDIRSAALKLDAVAIYQAKQRAEEELKAEQDQYTIEQRRRDEDYRDQLAQYRRERRERVAEYKKAIKDTKERYKDERSERMQAYRKDLRDLEQAHSKERAARIADFNEKLRREDQQRRLERQHQEQSWAVEDARRQQQYQTERNALGEHYSRLLSLTTNGLYQVELAYEAWLSSTKAKTASLGTGTVYGSSRGGYTISSDLGFARGGYPPLNRDVMVGERGPELVRFRQPARIFANGQRPGAFDGATIVINVDGSRSPMQTAYVTRRELESLIRSKS